MTNIDKQQQLSSKDVPAAGTLSLELDAPFDPLNQLTEDPNSITARSTSSHDRKAAEATSQEPPVPPSREELLHRLRRRTAATRVTRLSRNIQVQFMQEHAKDDDMTKLLTSVHGSRIAQAETSDRKSQKAQARKLDEALSKMMDNVDVNQGASGVLQSLVGPVASSGSSSSSSSKAVGVAAGKAQRKRYRKKRSRASTESSAHHSSSSGSASASGSSSASSNSSSGPS